MPKLPAKSNFSEWFTQIVSPDGASLADVRYGVQGFIVHMPHGMKILRVIYELLERELEADGHEPVLFPTVIKKENLDREEEHAGFAPEVFWVTQAGKEKLEEPVALRPTGETQIYPMYSLWVRSHNQLPLKLYQSRITVFRNEMTTRPFLRGREFMFLETHNVYANHEQAEKQIKEDMRIMQDVITGELKIPFYFFKRPKWEAFLGADWTYTADTILPDGRSIQISSTHDLGTNFAKAFNVTFLNEQNQTVHAYQTCFGPGVWRIMAALIAIHGDDNGLGLPVVAAPTQVAVVPIFKTDEEKGLVTGAIEELVKHITHRHTVDWSNQTPGFKFNEWELKGAALRIEIGPRDIQHGTVIMKRRFGEKTVVKLKDFKKALKEELAAHDHDLHTRATTYFKGNTRDADTLSDIKKIVEEFRGFVVTNWCSMAKDGAACAKTLKEEADGAFVCGERLDEKQKLAQSAVCAVCSKPATARVYVAKRY